MKELTPKQIVKELDKYVIGQNKAKKSVAIALRNRYRRNLLDEEFQEEVKPKNILMIGSTGVGKTEIAKRLAKLVKAPFLKIEATKFTEVGYVGRDVESMIRDLVETSIRMLKTEKIEEVYDKGQKLAVDKIVNILLPLTSKKNITANPLELLFGANSNHENSNDDEVDKEDIIQKRKELRNKLLNNKLEEEMIEIEVEDNKNSSISMLGVGMEDLNINFNELFGGMIPKSTKKRKVTIKEAKKHISIRRSTKTHR